jgi:hypothetical protein
METIAELFKKCLVGKVINGLEIISVNGLFPWTHDASEGYYYGNSDGVQIDCKVKSPDKRAKLGYKIIDKTFDMDDYIQ